MDRGRLVGVRAACGPSASSSLHATTLSPWIARAPGTWHLAPDPASYPPPPHTHFAFSFLLLSLILHKGLSVIVSFSFLSLAFSFLSRLVSSRLVPGSRVSSRSKTTPKTASSLSTIRSSKPTSTFPNAFPPRPLHNTKQQDSKATPPYLHRYALHSDPPLPPLSTPLSIQQLALTPLSLCPNVATVPSFRHVQQPRRRGA